MREDRSAVPTRELIVTGHTAGPLDLLAALGADTSAPGAAIINRAPIPGPGNRDSAPARIAQSMPAQRGTPTALGSRPVTAARPASRSSNWPAFLGRRATAAYPSARYSSLRRSSPCVTPLARLLPRYCATPPSLLAHSRGIAPSLPALLVPRAPPARHAPPAACSLVWPVSSRLP